MLTRGSLRCLAGGDILHLRQTAHELSQLIPQGRYSNETPDDRPILVAVALLALVRVCLPSHQSRPLDGVELGVVRMADLGKAVGQELIVFVAEHAGKGVVGVNKLAI